jgi:pyruvate dehydrogenase E2 component (dihydrolipoamide acetyltransferase)
MATRLAMPKLGLLMTEGMIVEWLKQDGEQVEKGQPVVVVMTEKIAYEVEAPASGTLRILAQPEETRLVGEVIGFILAPGEAMPEIEEAAPPPTAAVAVSEAKKSAPPPSPAPPGEAPRAVRASPAARRLARELGVDINQVQGTGRGGRITKDDVLRALEGREGAVAAPPKVIPFAGMRQAIAEGVMESLHSTAQLTLTSQADVTALVGLRDVLRQRWDAHISYTDLIAKAAALALREHPILNSMLVGGEIVLREEISIGIAVALEAGLIVPVVREADRKSVLEIHRAVQDLAKRAREGSLSVDEVTGSTFTITNLGMYGVDAFTPILNLPEVAILGVGRITEELGLVNGQVASRLKMVLSLTIDHRIVDGAPGAAFLQTLVQFLEHPALISTAGEA